MPKNIENSENPLSEIFSYVHNQIQTINNSKLFAGLMIITLNIASRFVNLKLSKTMESYLKYTFSRQILVFAIAWMGTRDIYISVIITAAFIIVTDYLFHEDSAYCALSNSFKEHHMNLLDNNPDNEVTADDIAKAKLVLLKAEEQKKNIGYSNIQNYTFR